MKKEIKIINLTPHDIILFKDNKKILFKSQGAVRVNYTSKLIGEVDGISIYRNTYTDVNKIPKYKKNTYYIVSKITMEILKNRKDLLMVNETVRDEKGHIIGCRSFARL